MAIGRRPHRRDRRKPAPNTQGGKIGVVTVLRNTTGPDGDAWSAMIVTQSASLPDPGWIPVTLVAASNIDTTGWAVFDSTGEMVIQSITVTGTGQVEVSCTEDMVGASTLIIPPFAPDLRSTNGDACAGGVLEGTPP